MEQSNSSGISTVLKRILAGLVIAIPLVAYASVNTFDYIKGTKLDVDNVRVDGNTISTLNTNGNLTFDMNGTGSVIFTDLTLSTVPYLDASKKLTSSAVTPTELGYVSGVTSTLCGINQACALTNKTLSGNTAVTLISGSGTLTLNTTGTVTVPNATDTLVGKATSDTLTNKTIDADGTGNVITNIENADIKNAAAIAVNKLAAVTVSRALVSDGSGFVSAATTTATEIGYVNGVTSGIQAQIDALSAGTSPLQPYGIINCSIAASVAGGSLTVALKDATGADASGGSPCIIASRSATATSGVYTNISTTAALSVVAATGQGLGCDNTSGVACTIYVYVINTGSAYVLALSTGIIADDGIVQTSSNVGTAGNTLYSTANQTSKPVRLIGRVTDILAGSDIWSNAPVTVSNWPFDKNVSQAVTDTNALGSWAFTAGQYGDLSSIILEAGEWDITGDMTVFSNGATTTTLVGLGISTTSGNNSTGLTLGDTLSYIMKSTTSGNYESLHVKTTATATGRTIYYLKGLANTSTTNLQQASSIIARRVR